MTRRTKEPPKDSIRAKLGEPGNVWTIQQMRAMTIEALDEIAASGITHVRGGNLYVNPVDAKGNADHPHRQAQARGHHHRRPLS